MVKNVLLQGAVKCSRGHELYAYNINAHLLSCVLVEFRDTYDPI